MSSPAIAVLVGEEVAPGGRARRNEETIALVSATTCVDRKLRLPIEIQPQRVNVKLRPDLSALRLRPLR